MTTDKVIHKRVMDICAQNKHVFWHSLASFQKRFQYSCITNLYVLVQNNNKMSLNTIASCYLKH